MNFEEKDLVRIAKRENNRKRNYLVVNPLQAKHVPVSPGMTMRVFEDLAEKIRNRYLKEKLLVIGFAETATAIGAHVAIALEERYIQTTRESMENVDFLYFEEEHSHATEQKLVKNGLAEVLSQVNRVVFVEDEITTGNTVLNIVSVMKKEYGQNVRFSVASILNGMSEADGARFRENEIETVFLVKTDHSLYSRKADAYRGDGIYHELRIDTMKPVREYRVPGGINARMLTDGTVYRRALITLWNSVSERISNVSGRRILVLGTEECMYPAIFVGAEIEKKGARVLCHSTTRSPITVSSETDYPLHERYQLLSVYDPDRKTYIYDLHSYDLVLIVTDADIRDTGGIRSLYNAISFKNKEIELIRWCDH